MERFEWNDEAEEKFSELFDKLDKDGSGNLTFDEVRNGGLQQGASAVGGMGASDEEVNQFIEKVDKDGDGLVSKDEFRQFLKDLLAMLQEQMSHAQQAHVQSQQRNQEHTPSQKFQWDDEAERKFQEMFHELDEDKTGKLTFDEVKSGSLKKCAQLFGHNPTDAEVYEFMNQIDLDGDGAVTEDEFRKYLQDFIGKLQDPKKMLEEAVNAMMKAIDKDGNGLCSKEEFKAFVQEKGATPLTDEEVDELFNDIDKDGDKTTLNKDELLTVLQMGLANC